MLIPSQLIKHPQGSLCFIRYMALNKWNRENNHVAVTKIVLKAWLLLLYFMNNNIENRMQWGSSATLNR